jgi:hypothetical protein
LVNLETQRDVSLRNSPSLIFSKPSGPQSEGNLATDDDVANSVRVKGINFLTCLDAIQKLHGPLARVRIEKETPGEVGNALRFGGIVVGGWYKASWYRAFWRSIAEQLNIDEAGARRLGHKAATVGVSGAYRALAKMSSPALLLSMSARAFGYYFDKGQLVVKQPEPSQFTAEWTLCIGFDSLIWSAVLGGATYFVEATGVTQIEVSVLGGGGNSPWMLATANFRA